MESGLHAYFDCDDQTYIEEPAGSKNFRLLMRFAVDWIPKMLVRCTSTCTRYYFCKSACKKNVSTSTAFFYTGTVQVHVHLIFNNMIFNGHHFLLPHVNLNLFYCMTLINCRGSSRTSCTATRLLWTARRWRRRSPCVVARP